MGEKECQSCLLCLQTQRARERERKIEAHVCRGAKLFFSPTGKLKRDEDDIFWVLLLLSLLSCLLHHHSSREGRGGIHPILSSIYFQEKLGPLYSLFNSEIQSYDFCFSHLTMRWRCKHQPLASMAMTGIKLCLDMELFSRRRWRLYLPKLCLWQIQTQTWYHPIHVWLLGCCSSPSTKELLHGFEVNATTSDEAWCASQWWSGNHFCSQSNWFCNERMNGWNQCDQIGRYFGLWATF